MDRPRGRSMGNSCEFKVVRMFYSLLADPLKPRIVMVTLASSVTTNLALWQIPSFSSYVLSFSVKYNIFQQWILFTGDPLHNLTILHTTLQHTTELNPVARWCAAGLCAGRLGCTMSPLIILRSQLYLWGWISNKAHGALCDKITYTGPRRLLFTHLGILLARCPERHSFMYTQIYAHMIKQYCCQKVIYDSFSLWSGRFILYQL